NILACADLYALLELSERTSTTELKRKADAEYQRVRTHGDKSKPDINARQELYGHCLKLFDSDGERAKYDFSLSRVRLTAIEEMAAQAGVGESKIGMRVMEELIKQGKQRGIAKEEVIDCVRGIAVKKGWLVELPSTPEADRMELCGVCGALGPTGNACGKCGTPFRQPCPKCGQVNPSATRNCGKCRFAIGDMPLAERSVNSARALAPSDLAGAMAAVDEALSYWPGHPQAVELKKKLEARLAELRDRENRIREFLDRFDRQRAKREFEGALATLNELQRLAPERPELATLRPIADAGQREAAAHVARGKKFLIDGKSDDALTAFETALASCSDSREANEAMKSCPPESPAGVAAVASTNGASLTWKPSPSRGRIEYQLVRKSGTPPTRPDDGEKIATSTNTTHIDTAAPSGQRLYYAVFALRAGVPSHQAALAGPIVRIAEVFDLVAQGGDGSIALTW
ncbi:MAG TPA: hypothetical protein PLV92_24250, partial [Pirellulaceae bacterium]|nr:hypothetical protein [Pirellulaceae bacterium]